MVDITAFEHVGLAVRIVVNKGGRCVADNYAPVATACRGTGRPLVQPADHHRPTGVEFRLQHGCIAVGAQPGLQAEALQRLYLRLWIGRIAEPVTNFVVGIVAAYLAVEACHHSSA